MSEENRNEKNEVILGDYINPNRILDWNEKYISRTNVARIFNVKPLTITNWANKGILRYETDPLSGYRYYPKDAVIELLERKLELPMDEIRKLWAETFDKLSEDSFVGKKSLEENAEKRRGRPRRIYPDYTKAGLFSFDGWKAEGVIDPWLNDIPGLRSTALILYAYLVHIVRDMGYKGVIVSDRTCGRILRGTTQLGRTSLRNLKEIPGLVQVKSAPKGYPAAFSLLVPLVLDEASAEAWKEKHKNASGFDPVIEDEEI